VLQGDAASIAGIAPADPRNPSKKYFDPTRDYPPMAGVNRRVDQGVLS
jgi:hypothetical protein